MRVLLVSGSFPPMRCGVGSYTATLAARLERRPGLSVGVLTGVDADSAGPRHDVLDVVESWTSPKLPSVAREIVGWRPDLVHIQFPTQGYDGRLAKLLPLWLRAFTGIPVIETLHELYATSLRFPLLQVLPARGFLVVRPRFHELIKPWWRLWLRGKPFQVVPNAPSLPRVVLSGAEAREVRTRHSVGDKALLVYFGFLYPRRGVEELFEIGDPDAHHILVVGAVHPQFPEYSERIVALTEGRWKGSADFLGYLPDPDAARVLAAADAVVLPFVGGGGSWNTSIRSAAFQGTFVLTTSTERRGYDADQNVYYAKPGDVQEMRQALSEHVGQRRTVDPENEWTWEDVADAHVRFYDDILRKSGRHGRTARAGELDHDQTVDLHRHA